MPEVVHNLVMLALSGAFLAACLGLGHAAAVSDASSKWFLVLLAIAAGLWSIFYAVLVAEATFNWYWLNEHLSSFVFLSRTINTFMVSGLLILSYLFRPMLKNEHPDGMSHKQAPGRSAQ